MSHRPLVLLILLLSAVSGTRILTRSMIRSPRESEEQTFQRVPLLLRPDGEEGKKAVVEAPKTARLVSPDTGPHEKLEDLFRELPSQRLEEELPGSELQEVPLWFAESQEPITEEPTTESQITTTLSSDIQPEENVTQVQTNRSNSKRTFLYPVARLWEIRSETDIWSLLHAAYLCLFSGIHCFSDKVYPMFRSYLGLNTGTRPMRYPLLLPRTQDSDDDDGGGEEEGGEEEEETEAEESRGLLRGRLLKELLIGLLLAHATLLPWLGGVGIASGKALFTGLLSLGAAGAVAAIDSQNNM